MRKHTARRVAALAAIALVSLAGASARADAQSRAESPLAAAERLRHATGDSVSIRWSNATGVARFVRATGDTTIPVSTSTTTLEGRALAFFEQWGALFGVQSPETELVSLGTTSDEAGSSASFGQSYKGLPVFNSELVVHFDAAGGITAVNGTYVPGLKVPTEPKVGAATAASDAIGAVAQQLGVSVVGLAASQPVLGVHRTGLAQDGVGVQALAWKTTVTGLNVRQFVYVDAISGGTLETFEGIHEAMNRQTFNMLGQSNYDLAVKCRFEGDPPSGEPDCDNAHTYSGDTYNFYWNGFRRDSFDGAGTPLRSYVHYFSTICPNAFWNGAVMTYCSTFPHDDVAGHEITHGVTEFSANLVYAYQPGALNESFSDIFGEAIDLLNTSENEPGQEWLIGEGIAPLVGLRNMRDPSAEPWRDPDRCGSPNYHCAASDSGGVHTNSGVPNKAFYLMVEGGTFNGVTVTGIGLAKASAVQYRTLTRYLTVYSNFVDAYEALQASCRDLRNKRITDPDPETGGGVLRTRISRVDCGQVKAALDAVELTKPVCTTTVPAAAGPLCADGETVASLFKDDHETGSPGWTASSVDNEPSYTAPDWTPVSDFTASGTHAWRVDDDVTPCSGGDFTSDRYLVSPEVNLTGTTRPTLRFLHDFFTEGGYDGGTVEILINGSWVKIENGDFTLNGYNGQMNLDSTAPNWTVLSRRVFTGYRTPGQFPKLTYAESRANLSSYVAQDTDKVVQFRFRFGTDFCNGTDIGWYLDDVEVYDCTAGAGAPATPAPRQT
jgi:Zn-dependent metalloprotease